MKKKNTIYKVLRASNMLILKNKPDKDVDYLYATIYRIFTELK